MNCLLAFPRIEFSPRGTSSIGRNCRTGVPVLKETGLKGINLTFLYVKVKLPLCLMKYHIMKDVSTQRRHGVEV